MIDWPSYNQSLIRRGLDGWNHELSQINQGKVGEHYNYPDSFIKLLGCMRVYFHLPYRQREGVVIAHASRKFPAIPHYSTISRLLADV